MDDKPLTQDELCEWLRVTPMTVYRWRKAGMPHLGSRKSLRYEKAKVVEWLEKNGHTKK